MTRSFKKGPFADDHVMKKVIAAKKTNDSKPIRTWSRRSTVIPDMIGLTSNVHNGKVFIPVHITENHIGYKLGEFTPIQTFKGHRGFMQKKIGK